MIAPATSQELAGTLHGLASAGKRIHMGGNFSKRRLGGETTACDETVSSRGLNRLLAYDPRDLTISVEAGMKYAELERILTEQNQMLPLDPGWHSESTVGGVVGANLSGPRRRAYGTVRDMIIGMTFATLEGTLIQSGGMVVKNVAGLDMAKLMIGSFGTLAAIATVNFKVFPIPAGSRTFVLTFASVAEALAERDRILRSALQPVAVDLVNWPSGFRLLVGAAGNPGVLDRFHAELPSASVFEGEQEQALWHDVREFGARFLADHPDGSIVTNATTMTGMRMLLESASVPFIARAANGVAYFHHPGSIPVARLDGDLEVMKKIKAMFDPGHLLNPGRLYGHI